MPMFVLDKTLYSRDFFSPWDLPHPLHHCQNEPSTHRSLYLHLRCNTYEMSRGLDTTMDTGRGKFVWGWGWGCMQLGPSNIHDQYCNGSRHVSSTVGKDRMLATILPPFISPKLTWVFFSILLFSPLFLPSSSHIVFPLPLSLITRRADIISYLRGGGETIEWFKGDHVVSRGNGGGSAFANSTKKDQRKLTADEGDH